MGSRSGGKPASSLRAAHRPIDERRRAFLHRRRTSVATLALGAVAVLTVIVAASLEGLTGGTVVFVCAFAFVVPGDALRRAVRAPALHGVFETMAVDFVGSCAVLIALGGFLNAFGGLTRGKVVLLTGVVLVGLVACAIGSADRAAGASASVRAFCLILILASVSVSLFHIAPQIGDRIFLGQMRTSIEIVQHRQIPTTTWTFGARTSFPINYVFYNLIFGLMTKFGGLNGWAAWKLLAAALRLVQLGLFSIVWYLAGRALLRRFRPNLLTTVCAAALPAVLLFNLGLINKFREPLVEGFGIILLGVALWARLRADGERRASRSWFSGLSVLAVALLVGIHFPVFSEAVFLIGALVVVVAASGPGETFRSKLVSAARVAGLYVGATVGALIAMQVLVGATPISVASDAVSRRSAFRAYLLYVGDPLTNRSLRDFVMQRWSSAFLLTQDPFTDAAVMIGVVALIGIVIIALRSRKERAVILWLIGAATLTAVYVGLGFFFGRTVISPWNAVTRNGFYIWFPITIAGVLGLRVALTAVEARRTDGLVRSRLRTGARVITILALVVGLVFPFFRFYRQTFSENGWMLQSQMTPNGERALQWIVDHTPAQSVVLTSEDTFGSSLVTQRQMVTEGFATLESGPVTRAAVRSLTQATEFLLPAHSPKILIEQHVDYVVARSGAYLPAELGGYPLLATFYTRLLPVLSETLLEQVPYLHAVARFGAVAVYHVERNEIPPTTIVRLEPGQPAPPCTVGVCLEYQRISSGVCPPAQTSTERDLCIIRKVADPPQ